MQKSNRNFYKDKDSDVILENDVSDFNYNGLSVNLFDVKKYGNIELQDLDLKFVNELDKNSDRFKFYQSNEKFKDWFICPYVIMVVFIVLSLTIKYVLLPNSSFIVDEFFKDVYYKDYNFTVEFFNYIFKQSLIFINIMGMILSTICVLVYLLHKPFISSKDGKFDIVITDNVGFYLIKCDRSNVYENELEKLYFVQYACSELGIDMDNHVYSVSYYSSYSCSMKDKRYYVLDLPNESSEFSNAYDLEFARKYFDNSDYNELVKYLDETEDN